MAEAEKPTLASKQAQESISGKFSQTLQHKKGDTFVGSGTVELHEPIAVYEGRHRYDPSAEWTRGENLDYCICSWVCLTFFALQLDPGNISQALSDPYSYSQMIFYLRFLCTEMMTCSLIVIFQCLISGTKGFYATMNWELPMRVGFFYCASYLTYIGAVFLAFGSPHKRYIGGLEEWRRVLRDDPGKGGTHNRQGLTLKLLWVSLTNYDLRLSYAISWTILVLMSPVSAYLTLKLKSPGFDTFETNLLTIPVYVLFLIQLLFWSWVSERINNRMAVMGFFSLYPWSWHAVTVPLIEFPYIHVINDQCCQSYSRNAGTVRTRTVGSALYNMICQASSTISSNIYRESDKLYYRRENKVLLALVA
ncbi:hypothetical protein BDW75DRAFT_226765 [Aspergillus navahoensis]